MAANVSGELFAILGAFLVIIAIGIFLRQRGVLDRGAAEILNNLIINVTLPALVIVTILKADLRAELVLMPVIAVAVMVVTGGIAWLIGRSLQLERGVQGGFILAAAHGNTAYLGYPIVLAAYGAGGLVQGIFFDYGAALVIFILGAAVARHYGHRDQKHSLLRELLTFPPLLALPIGLLLRTATTPSFVIDSLGLLGEATVPLVMLSIGLSLRMSGLRRSLKLTGVTAVLKLAVAPIVCVLLLYLVSGMLPGAGLGSVSAVAIVQSGMPTGVLTIMFALKYGLDEEFLSSAVLLTTIAGLVTLPILVTVLRSVNP